MRAGELSEDRVRRVVIGVALLLCGSAGLARADERLWSIALKDARLMADLQSALTRADDASNKTRPLPYL